jgi:hypothetical protein
MAKGCPMGNVIRLARRPVPALIAKPKAKQRGHWAGVPGLVEVFQGERADHDQAYLVAAITERFGIVVTRAVVTSMRQSYSVPQTPETRRRGYESRGGAQAAKWTRCGNEREGAAI